VVVWIVRVVMFDLVWLFLRGCRMLERNQYPEARSRVVFIELVHCGETCLQPRSDQRTVFPSSSRHSLLVDFCDDYQRPTGKVFTLFASVVKKDCIAFTVRTVRVMVYIEVSPQSRVHIHCQPIFRDEDQRAL
jgi:hypothetical protein